MSAEPYKMTCPKCGTTMDWNPNQGPMGGWKCPNDGLRIDKKQKQPRGAVQSGAPHLSNDGREKGLIPETPKSVA